MNTSEQDPAPPEDPSFESMLQRRLRTGSTGTAVPGAAHDADILRAAAASASRIRQRRRRRWQAPMALAAGLVLAVGVTWQLQRAGPEPLILRGGAAAGEATPPNEAVLVQAPESLAWPPVDGADAYTLSLRDASGELLWQAAQIEQERIDLPPEVRASLPASGTFLWQVTAERPGGAVPAGNFWFEIRP